MEKSNKIWKIRIPLPKQRDKFHSSKKGKRGYNRDKNKQEILKDLLEEE